MALASFSLVPIRFRIFHCSYSYCRLSVSLHSLYTFWRLYATWCHIRSCSFVGSREIADSASSARLLNQCLFLWLRLVEYSGHPFGYIIARRSCIFPDSWPNLTALYQNRIYRGLRVLAVPEEIAHSYHETTNPVHQSTLPAWCTAVRRLPPGWLWVKRTQEKETVKPLRVSLLLVCFLTLCSRIFT